MINYYICDTETTGLSTKIHEVVEISIVRCSDRVQLTQFIKAEHPENANFDALKITNKTMADLQKGDSKEVAIEKIDKFFAEDGGDSSNRCLICHNASFDQRFMHAFYSSANKKCPVDLWLCTMALTKKYAKQIGLVKPKVNLHAACDIVGVKKLSAAHASKVDSRNTYLLWKNLVEEKKIDYIPLIKTAIHNVSSTVVEENEGLDPDLLDMIT